MSPGAALAAVAAITLVNLAIVGASSLFAVGGDGSARGVYWVLGIGSLWVLAFTTLAIWMVHKGEQGRAVGLTAKAIPYALLAVVLSQFLLPLFR